MKENKIIKAVKNALCGAVIGISNVIPGVSGGTMAVVLNIYDELLDAISIKRLKKNLFFLITVIIGLVLGVLLFSKAIGWLFDNYPVQTNCFFAGLIVGSIPLIYGKATATRKLRPVNVIPFLVAIGLMIVLFIFGSDEGMDGNAMTSYDVGGFFLLVFAGAVSAFAMIVPGISGSMIMVIIGTYRSVITAISDLNIVFLIPVGVGILIGLIGGIKLVKVLMEKAPQATYCAILGLVLGSLLSLWPWGAALDSVQVILSIVVFAVGFLVAVLFGRSKKEDEAKAARQRAK